VPALDLHFGDGKGQNLLDQELLTISGELWEMAALLLVGTLKWSNSKRAYL
jgi:hypothetical protein